MNIAQLASQDKIDRIDSGTGYVHEHSFEIGDAVVAIQNVGSITIVDGERNPLPMILGILGIIIGLAFFAVNKMLGLVVMAGSGFLIYWALQQTPDIFLSIGTCDGRRTHIVSKDREFLTRIRDFLRQKIDQKLLQTATININARTISGGLAFGGNAQATGRSGDIQNG